MPVNMSVVSSFILMREKNAALVVLGFFMHTLHGRKKKASFDYGEREWQGRMRNKEERKR